MSQSIFGDRNLGADQNDRHAKLRLISRAAEWVAMGE